MPANQGQARECNFSLSSSMQDMVGRLQGNNALKRPPIPHESRDPSESAVRVGSTKRRELDKIEGVPAYPTTAEFSGWKREVRYAVASASTEPQRALAYVLEAEKWTGDILRLGCDPNFDTLEVKFGKALRSILRGDARREVANLEEQVLREQGRLLNGREIYAWIVRQFKRDAKLARPQILQELGMVQLGFGKNALRSFKTRWDAAVEKLVALGGTKESDEEILYIYFKQQFMRSEDLADSIAKVRRSPTSSNVHTYEWMYL